MASEGKLLWQPRPEWLETTNMYDFMQWLKSRHQLEFKDYHALWRWSTDHLEDFWEAIWQYYHVEASAPYDTVLVKREMPGAKWFPGARLNYAQHILRNEKPGTDALYFAGENAPLRGLPWEVLGNNVRVLATQLRTMGIKSGDRVSGYMPNIPETIMAMLACASIGATWSCCSPDFGSPSVIDRLSQIEPHVLICVDGYSYRGKQYDRRKELSQIISKLPTVQHIIYLPRLDADRSKAPAANAVFWEDLLDHAPVAPDQFNFEQVAFDHPLWILFSSGTTGLPKAIVQSHGGIMLEQLKLSGLHFNLKPGDRLFFYTTTGWMMWNFLVSCMLLGVCPILYDGNPTYPEADVLWKLADEGGAKVFGTSPTFIQMQEKEGIVPKNKYRFEKLESIMPAGSPVTAKHMEWLSDNVKKELWQIPGSGGTDVCSGFVGGTPMLPVYAGEIQAPHLGVDANAFDENGNSVINQVGELVITKPMPSMPLYFWNDENDRRYKETYFDEFPGVWRQGDYFMINERDGCFVLGRSDATLNRYGVRIGTAEIYRAVEALDEVKDSLVINLDLPGGNFFMPMFVVLADGLTLNADIEKKIGDKLRSDYSPRHVPDKIYQVKAIPYTLSNKKMEIPVRKILMGKPVSETANRGVMANPDSLDYFVDYAREQNDYTLS